MRSWLQTQWGLHGTQAEAHVHLGTGATSHPRVCDTGASETRAPVLVPEVHKSPAVTTGTRALRDLHAAPRKKQNKTKNSSLHPTPPSPGPFRGWCPLHPRTHAHLFRARPPEGPCQRIERPVAQLGATCKASSFWGKDGGDPARSPRGS